MNVYIDPEVDLFIKEFYGDAMRRHITLDEPTVSAKVRRLYWSIGGDISCRMWENKYGSRFYETLSRDLSAAIPELGGISATSLKYCRYFYELYIQHGVNRPQLADESGSEKNRPQLADDSRKPDGYLMDESVFQIPWGHHRAIIDKAKVVKESFTTTRHGAIEGKLQNVRVTLYNLGVIISVGYRVKSMQGTQFRMWATGVLPSEEIECTMSAAA